VAGESRNLNSFVHISPLATFQEHDRPLACRETGPQPSPAGIRPFPGSLVGASTNGQAPFSRRLQRDPVESPVEPESFRVRVVVLALLTTRRFTLEIARLGMECGPRSASARAGPQNRAVGASSAGRWARWARRERPRRMTAAFSRLQKSSGLRSTHLRPRTSTLYL
jgi:hypothetical protein